MKNSRVRLCMSSVFVMILYYLAEAGFEFLSIYLVFIEK